MGDPDRCDVAVLAYGTPAIDAVKAAEAIHAETGGDVKVAVWDARFAKPVDSELLGKLLPRPIPVLTVEDHGVVGGFGAAVLEAAQELALDASRVTRLALPDHWIYQDPRAAQLAEVGLDPVGIARSIRAALAANESRDTVAAVHVEPKPARAHGAV